MKIAVFAGSFCPVTNGHYDLIKRASSLVDKLYVVVGFNINKVNAISVEDRVNMLQTVTANLTNVEVDKFDGMMTDFAKQVGANIIFKSVRNGVELQEVLDVNDLYDNYWDGEIVILPGSAEYRAVSSSAVRELIALKQDVSKYVPSEILSKVLECLR